MILNEAVEQLLKNDQIKVYWNAQHVYWKASAKEEFLKGDILSINNIMYEFDGNNFKIIEPNDIINQYIQNLGKYHNE